MLQPDWADLRGTLGGSEDYASRTLAQIERIIIHHVGPPGGNRDYSAREIADYHVKSLKWPGIGYHFLAHPDGRLDYVGDILTVRYHAGLLNPSSVGVCLAGDFSVEEPTAAQLATVRALCSWLPVEIGRVLPVVGHRDVSHLTGYGFTECPGDTWPQWKSQVA